MVSTWLELIQLPVLLLQDIAKKHAAIIYGICNGTASLAAALSSYLTGVVLDQTHSWPMVFELLAGVYLVGLLVFLAFADGEQIFD